MGFSFLSTYIALWTAVVLQGVLILAVLQRLEKLRQLMERGRSPKETLPIGTSAPQFSATDWSGRPASLQDFARQAGLVLFLSPTCYVCKDFVDTIAFAKDELPPIIAFCVGEQEGCTAFAKRLVPQVRFALDVSGDIAARYGASAYPRAIVIDTMQKIRGYAYPRTAADLKRIVAESLGEEAGPAMSASELSTSSARSK